MVLAVPPERRRAGRPLSFDRDEALHQAMLLFWRHGYEGTSVSDLTAAMRINPPSLYTAFGDKKQLFLEAVHRYLGDALTGEPIKRAATARAAAWDLLQSAVIGFSGSETPPGCLLASAAISCSADAADVQTALASMRREIGRQLHQRIEAAVAAGELPAETDAEGLACHVMAVVQGLSTLARDGARRETLMRVAQTAMQVWPRVDDGSQPLPSSAPATVISAE